MIKQNKSTAFKILIASLIVAVLIFSAINVASVLAKPQLKGRVLERDYGTLDIGIGIDYDDVDQWKIVDIVKGTTVIIGESCWKDVNEDGIIDLDDVYAQEEANTNTLVNHEYLHVIDPGEDYSYYVVYCSDIDGLDGIEVGVNVANNNNFAELKDSELYYYENEDKILYIDKSVFAEALEKQETQSIRFQLNVVVEDIKTCSKAIPVSTMFNIDMEKSPVQDRVIDELHNFNIMDASTHKVEFQFCSPNDLAYFSPKNMTLYVNGNAVQLNFDTTTGIISLPEDISIYDVNDIFVYVDKLNDLNANEDALLSAQQNFDTPLAAGWADVPTHSNIEIYYGTKAPKIGDVQLLDFVMTINYNTHGSFQYLGDEGSWIYSYPVAIRSGKNYPSNETIVKYYTQDLNGNNLGWRPPYGDAIYYLPNSFIKDHPDWFKTEDMGPIANLSYGNEAFNNELFAYIEHVYELVKGKGNTEKETAAKRYILDNLTKLQSYKSDGTALLSPYYSSVVFSNEDGSNYTILYQEVVGLEQGAKNILGGELRGLNGNTSPKAWFSLACTHINRQIINESTSQDYANIIGGSYVHPYMSSLVIVDVDETNKLLYVAIVPQQVYDPNLEVPQRLAGFTKIPYNFDATGKIGINKYDEFDNSQLVGGAQYSIYKTSSCSESDKVGIITTSSEAITYSENLPYGTYYLKETSCPNGYLLDETVYSIKVSNEDKAPIVQIKEKRQNVELSYAVYDKDTMNYSTSKPVSGVKFKIEKQSGSTWSTVANVTTGSDGAFSLTLPLDVYFNNTPRTTTYRVVQTETVQDYAMSDDKCRNTSEGIDKFTIATDGLGVNKTRGGTHYEPRQRVSIQSHVQDSFRGINTPAGYGSEFDQATKANCVSLQDAKYDLVALTDLFIGYNTSGEKIIRRAGSTILSNVSSGIISGDNKAYITASVVTIDGTTYKLPNGKYQWVMKSPSLGYYVNQTNNAHKTDIDLSWSKNNSSANLISSNIAVTQYREKAQLKVFVKAYDKENSTLQTYVANTEQYFNGTSGLINHNLRTSNSNGIPSKTSTESINFTINGATYRIAAQNIVPNTIYVVKTAEPIIALNKNGDIWPKDTIIGYYISGTDGSFTLNRVGTPLLNNPNENSKTNNPNLPAISFSGTTEEQSLPCGTYIIEQVLPADEFRVEKQFERMTVSLVPDANAINSGVNTAFLFNRQEEDNHTHPITAPDVPDQTPEDPYDPQNPDDPNNPDDSNDIPLPPGSTPEEVISWIRKHSNDYAYRVFDDNNQLISGSKIIFEVEDTLPNTFAFVGYDAAESERNITRKVFFYYEIPKSEYDSAPAAKKAPTGSQLTESYEYVQKKSGTNTYYFRRFSIPGYVSDAVKLEEVITLNETSPGFSSYSAIKDKNLAVSGAITNTDWINNKLRNAEHKGEYRLLIGIQTITTKTIAGSGQELRVETTNFNLGNVLTIKNRQLINLD